MRRLPSLGAERWKWEGSYEYIFAYATADEFINTAEANVNHVFVQEFSRHPERVYPACFALQPLAGGYFTPVKANGEHVSFQILEQ